MASISATIIKGNQKQDGTWNVVIRIWHNSKPSYIDTPHFVTKFQLGKKSKDSTALIIKDPYIIDRVAPLLKRYRDLISDRADHIQNMTAQELKQMLLNAGTSSEGTEIDFISFSKQHIDRLNRQGRSGSAKSLSAALNALIDFAGSRLPARKITYKLLREFESFLRSTRKIKRMNQGKLVDYVKKGLTDSGLHNRMRDIRILFNECRRYYNDEEHGIIAIPQNPFSVYKLVAAPESENRDISIDKIKLIRDMDLEPNTREELARDLYMLSFYLCGMNAADMFRLDKGDVDRVEYNRKKTETRRQDRAFISIAIPDVAKPFYEKYAGTLQERYASEESLNKALMMGLKTVAVAARLKSLDFYSARHTFGSLARNEAGNTKDDIALAMNHKDNTNKTTDIYIRKDWSIVDRVQESTIALLDTTSSSSK